MEEDDDFGDLYADLAPGAAAHDDLEAAGAAEPVSAVRGSIFDDDEDEFAPQPLQEVSQQHHRNEFRMPAVDPPPIRQEFTQQRNDQKPAVNAGVPSYSDDSDDDEDLNIVLNTAPSTSPFGAAPGNDGPESGATTVPTDGIHDDEPSWMEQQLLPPPLPPPPSTADLSSAPLQPPMPLSGLPPGLSMDAFGKSPAGMAGPPGLSGPPPGLSAPPPGLSGLPGPPTGPPGPSGLIPRPPGLAPRPFKYVRPPMAMGGPPGAQNPGMRFPHGQWRPQPRPGMWFPHPNEYHLPSTKTVFDMDLDALDDKPWRHPSVDISDYFNFGFNEITWKAYCQNLSQLRIEATMQSKISVYESGRSGDQLVGRAIQVENGMGERRPSGDLPKRNRNRDSEIIEIVLKDFEQTPPPATEANGSPEDDSQERRNGDGEGHPSFPMGGPRSRPPYRMGFPRGMRPPFYESGVPLPMRPEGYRGSARPDDEPSTGSVAAREDRDERKRRRGSHSSRSRDGGDNSSLSDDESRRPSRRPRRDGDFGEPKRASTSEKHEREERRPYRERDDRDERKPRDKDDDGRRPRDKDDDGRRPRDKDDDGRRPRDNEDLRRQQREKDDDASRRQRDDGDRRKEDERKRKDRDEAWRSDSQRRSRGYDEGYDRREDKRNAYEKGKHETPQRRDQEAAHERNRSASRGGREHSVEDRHGKWSSRSNARNGLTSDYVVDDRDRKRNKDVQTEKVQSSRDFDDERKARTSSKGEQHNSSRMEENYSSDEEDDGRRKKGRSKMERWSRERKEEGWTHEQTDEKASVKAGGTVENVSLAQAAPAVNGLDASFAKRRERFSQPVANDKLASVTDERKASSTTVVAKHQHTADEFKHERPARKRRWGN